MSENENGTPPSDPNEAATTIGLPTPARPAEEASASTSSEAVEDQGLVIEAKADATVGESSEVQGSVEADAAPQEDATPQEVVATPQPASEPQEASESDEEVHRSLMWPVDPQHQNAIGVLSESLSGVEVVSEAERPRPSRALNLLLLVICLGIGGAGSQQLSYYASADREARETEIAVCDANREKLVQTVANYHIEKLRALNKGDSEIVDTIKSAYFPSVQANEMEMSSAARADNVYKIFRELKSAQENTFFGLAGVLSIASEPPHAEIYKRKVGEKDFKPVMSKKNGKDVVAYTPKTGTYNVQVEDITQDYEFELRFTDKLKRFKELTDAEKKLLGEGEKPPVETHEVTYRAERFIISRYQWVKDGGTGDFGMNKLIKLIPNYVQGYHSFDWSKAESKTFETLEECETFQKSTDASICRAIPCIEDFDKVDARAEAKEKASKKRGRRRGKKSEPLLCRPR